MVLEDTVEPGSEWQLRIDDEESGRPARVVWVQDEADGQIAGVQFLDQEPAPEKLGAP